MSEQDQDVFLTKSSEKTGFKHLMGCYEAEEIEIFYVTPGFRTKVEATNKRTF